VIASVATSGDIHLWQISSPDNWAAFAPGFEELEENVEYDEREDEFDLVTTAACVCLDLLTEKEDETEMSRRKDLEEDLDIDVLTPDDSYPRNPDPYIPPKGSAQHAAVVDIADLTEETEEARSVRLMREAKDWADREGDDDTWSGFFVSLDLTETFDDDEI
jgi:COMPASS component SWD1